MAQVVAAEEVLAHADRPGRRRDVELQALLDLVQQVERVAPLAVHLVDEGDDRDVAQPADLEQLAGLRLDALGGVEHHHRRVDRGQRAVGVLAEVLVARRVEQVEGAAVILEGHHRGGDRDAALLLDLHPVRARAPGVAARLDRARQLDGAAEQQQLLGQRGLARVRVGDDGEGPPPGDRRRARGARGSQGLGHGSARTRPARAVARRGPPRGMSGNSGIGRGRTAPQGTTRAEPSRFRG